MIPFRSAHRRAWALSSLLAIGLAGSVRADIKMPAIFGDHMVLQRVATVPVWGTAAAGEKISVTLGSLSGNAVAGADGKWRVDLPPGPKNATPQTLTVAGTNTLTFQDQAQLKDWDAAVT